jgi:lipid-binding SYLF domain-containing protein
MKSENIKMRKFVAISSVALLLGGGFSIAQAATKTGSAESDHAATSRSTSSNEDAKDASQQLNKAAKVVAQMKRDPKLKTALQQAEGIFIVPDYGRAALGVGGRGGKGVLFAKQNGKWSDPAFYTFGGASLGLQAGAEAGELALILNNEKALDSFKQSNNWSLNADAGLTIVNWSSKAQASAGKGDVIVWAHTKGLLGDAAVSVTDINFDEKETGAFYGKEVTLQDIMSGSAHAPARQVAAIKRALPQGTSSGATSTGSSNGSAAQGTSREGTSGMQRSPDSSSDTRSGSESK